MTDPTDTIAYDFHCLNDGARLRYAVIEPAATPRGTIVVAPGRREFIEKKYSEIGAHLVSAGFRVILFEWRGQGLSDRSLSGPRRQRDHITDFDIHLRDFTQFFHAIVMPRRTGSLLLSGHSMGSHLLLRWLSETASANSAAIAGAIVTAPMLALGSLPVHGVAQAISWLEVKIGHGEAYAISQHDYNDEDRRFTGNPLSQDEDRFRIMEHAFFADPDLTVAGITWGWLHAALRSLHQIQRPSSLKRIACPVLAITGGRDMVTPAQDLSHYLQYIPNAAHIVVPGALHDILNELAIYRDEALREIDSFIARITAAGN